MGRYRKKPVVIEAFRLGIDYIPDWFMDAVTANKIILNGKSSGFDHYPDTNADIETLEGWHHANCPAKNRRLGLLGERNKQVFGGRL